MVPNVPDDRPRTALKPHLGPAFPQTHRVLTAALALQAHNDFTGHAWPEFEATKRGGFREADDDAAGITLKSRSHTSVVSAAPGATCQSYKRLLKGETGWYGPDGPDNASAEAFHRNCLATTQQQYLRHLAFKDNFQPALVHPAIPVVCKGRTSCLTAPRD